MLAKKQYLNYQYAFLVLLPPYKRKRLKAEIHDSITILRLTTKALANPSPTWLQNLPYMLHIFIHCNSDCPSFANTADCAAAATAATVTYAITCIHGKFIACYYVYVVYLLNLSAIDY